MATDRSVYGASRLRAAIQLLLMAAPLTALLFLPGALDYAAHGKLVSRLSAFDGWEPQHRLLLAFGFAGVCAALAVLALRRLIDNTAVVLDSDGIEVRHGYGTRRALWRNFLDMKVTKTLGTEIHLLFKPGQDAGGRNMPRKIRLPSSLLGVDNRAVVAEVMLRSVMNQSGLKPLAPIRPAAAKVADAMGRPVFGKRR